MNAELEGEVCAVHSEVGELGNSVRAVGFPGEGGHTCEAGRSIAQKGRSVGEGIGIYSGKASMILVLLELC
jgi:hypothetical protein